MKRAKFIGIAALLLVAIVWPYDWETTPGEPTYKGKPHTYWLDVYYHRQSYPRYGELEVKNAFDAIDAIGTNAMPVILSMLNKRDSLPTKFLDCLNRWQPFYKFRIVH